MIASLRSTSANGLTGQQILDLLYGDMIFSYWSPFEQDS
jgi:hypothetical protein